jgi:magnesium-transporting ATPase (P-type)
MDFLITIFEALGLYSAQNGLGEHLRGLDLECNEYSRQSIYNIIFICLFGINTILVINYYYGIFNRRPFNRWWWWLFNCLAGAVAVFAIALIYTNNDLSTANYCKDLQMTGADCVGFAITAAIFSFAWCIILTFLIKWKSSINRKVPF